MKKLKKGILIIFCLSLSAVSCNWEIPEKITVKQNAVYKFSAGTIEPNLGASLDFKSVIEDMFNSGENQTLTFYDYNPGGNQKTQQFLLRMPIAEIPIDFNDFLENSGLNNAVKGLSFDETIKIPQINMDINQEISMDNIKKAVNAAITFTNGNFVSEFESVQFTSGVLKLNSAMPDGTSVTVDSGGNQKTAIFSGGEASADLDNFTIVYSDFRIEVNGVNGQGFDGIAYVSETSEPKIVKGLKIKEPVTFPVELKFSAADEKSKSTFEECTIKKGELVTDIEIPQSWQGVNIVYDFETTGAMQLSVQNIEKTGNIPLESKKITSGETNANVNTTVSFAAFGATIDFSNPLKISIKSDIKTLESIAINIENEEFNTKISKTESFPEEMKNSIKEIVLEPSGLNIVYTNELPQGNDITLKTSSDFIGLTKKSATLESGKTAENKDILSDLGKTVLMSEASGFDFNADLTLPGATTENPKRIKLQNVDLGAEYKISMEIKPVINWKEITLSDNLAESLTQKNKMKLPFDLSDVFKNMSDSLGDADLMKKIEFEKLPVYIFCTKPDVKQDNDDPFKEAGFKGSIKLYYGKENAAPPTDKDNVEDLTDGGSIPFVSAPVMKFDENNKVLITDYSKQNSSASGDIAKLINKSLKGEIEEGSSLFVDYDLEFSNGKTEGITITKSMLNEDGSASIGVSAVVVLPLLFKANQNIGLDTQKLLGDAFSKDLLGRSSADDLSGIQEYTDYIKNVTILFENSKLPFYPDNLNLDFKINCGEKENGDPEAVAEVLKGTLSKGEINFSSDDLTNKIFKYYPAIPSIKLNIDQGKEFGLAREVGFAMKLTLEIETDCEIPVLGGEK